MNHPNDPNREQRRDDEPQIRVPITEYSRQLAREAGYAAAKEVLAGHVANCTARAAVPEVKAAAEQLEGRVRVLEGRFNVLIGAVIASGGVGGAVGAGILKLFGG